MQDAFPESGPFFLGDSFSVADIAAAPFIGRVYTPGKAGLIPAMFNTIPEGEAYRRFNDYAQAFSDGVVFVDEKVRQRK
jgi:glutathione S-transferase